MIEDIPLTESQNDVRNGCSSRVHSIDVKRIHAGEMHASTKPRENRIAKKPEKLNTAA